jgi:hypothetical protein
MALKELVPDYVFEFNAGRSKVIDLRLISRQGIKPALEMLGELFLTRATLSAPSIDRADYRQHISHAVLEFVTKGALTNGRGSQSVAHPVEFGLGIGPLGVRCLRSAPRAVVASRLRRNGRYERVNRGGCGNFLVHTPPKHNDSQGLTPTMPISTQTAPEVSVA